MDKDESKNNKRHKNKKGRPMGMAKASMQTHDQILLAAINEFAEKGFSATTIDDIVKAAGITKPALYYHFDNKEELFKSVLLEVHKRSIEWMEEIEKQKLNFHDLLEETVRLYQTMMRQHPSIAKMMLFLKLESKKNIHLWEFHRSLIQERITRFSTIMNNALKTVKLKPKITSEDIMKMLIGYVFISLTFTPEHPDIDQNKVFDESFSTHIADVMCIAFLEEEK